MIFAVPPVIIGIIIAMVKLAEMTFLPTVLNYFRLQLNSKTRIWSLGTDSFTEMEIGYVVMPSEKTVGHNNLSIESKTTEELTQNIGKL